MVQATETLTTSQPISYIHTLQEALKQRQEEIPFAYLMGVSGEAFRFFYNRVDPEAGMNTFLHNPLRTTCRALGFNHEVLYDETYEVAYDRLRENMRAEKPSLLPFPNCCPFLMEADRPENVICQNGKRSTLNLADLREMWQPGGGFLELGPRGYYQFVIGDRERDPKERDIALGAFRCANKMMRTRRKIHDCAVGLAAYEELISHLSGMISRKRKVTEREVYKVAKWNGEPLSQCIEARGAAVEYLQLAREHFEGEELEHLDKAIATYQDVRTLLRKLQTVLPSMPLLSGELDGSADKRAKLKVDLSFSSMLSWKSNRTADEGAKIRRKVMKQFKPSCRAAVKLLKEVHKVETSAVDELEEIVRISEKLKM